MSIKDLVGKKIAKKVKFMGTDVEINKLTVAQVEEVQGIAKELEANPERGVDVLKTVIRMSAVGGAELSDEDFAGFPMDELSNLSNAIMEHSGLGDKSKSGK
jgi:hypothetical protein